MIDWQKLTGEERNALIHEKVLGLPRIPCADGEINHNGYCFYCTCGQEGRDLDTLWRHHSLPIPAYSTSLDAAWAVLKKMASRHIPYADYDDEPLAYFASELLDNMGGEIYPVDKAIVQMSNDWTPEKICIAALRSMDYMEKEQ